MSTRVPPELAVLMHGRHIATLRRRGPARPLRLIYDPDVTAGTTPLSVTMPHVVPGHEGPHVRHWIAGLLPDRPEVLLAWRRAFAVASLEEYALLAHVGRDVAGAAQFCRPDRLGEATSPADLLEIDLAGVGARLAELADSTSGWGVQAGHAQFSLAGAQAKIALYFDAGRWAVPTGMAATTHILKPAIRGMAEQDLSEHLTMATAALLGLPVASTQVLLFAGHRALVVRRYDRLVRDGAVRRIHQEDLVQALGRPPTDKYQAGGGPGLADLLALLRRTVSPSARSEDVDSLLEAAAVNWLLGCTDAHARNYSLLLAGGEVRLAPLYDLNSFLPYASAPDRGVTLSMAIGPFDRYGSLEIDRHDWEWLARRANVDERRLVERVRWLADAVPDAAAQSVRSTPGWLADEPERRVGRRCAKGCPGGSGSWGGIYVSGSGTADPSRPRRAVDRAWPCGPNVRRCHPHRSSPIVAVRSVDDMHRFGVVGLPAHGELSGASPRPPQTQGSVIVSL